MSRHLYEISEDMALLECAMEDDSMSADEFEEKLKVLDDEFESKVEGYGVVMSELLADYESADKEAKRLKALASVRKAKYDKMCDYLKNMMIMSGKSAVHTNIFDFRLRNNPPAVWYASEDDIPDEFWKAKYEVDKAKIKEYLKTNTECEWATMKSSVSLSIK